MELTYYSRIDTISYDLIDTLQGRGLVKMASFRARRLVAILIVSALLPLGSVANAASFSSDTSGVRTAHSGSRVLDANLSSGSEEKGAEFSYAEVVTDPAVINSRVERLRQSDALTTFLSAKFDDVNDGLRIIAAIAPDEGIDALIENTSGMKFIETSSHLGVALVPEGTITSPDLGVTPTLKGTRDHSPQDFPTCWRGWLAAYAYFTATGMICGPLHMVGGVSGIICDGVFFTVGMLPDFDAPCKK